MKTGSDDIDIDAVEDHSGILTIRGGGRRDWNGKHGISRKNIRSKGPPANIATILAGLCHERRRY